MSHAGAVGELIVARIRLMLTVALLIVPIVMMAIEPWDEHYIAGLVILVSAVGIAFGVFSLVRRGFTSPWLGAVSTGLDVSLVSAALVTFLILEGPNAAVNSRVVFECYFIAIGVTCLRYDLRLCLFAGALAIVQYFAERTPGQSSTMAGLPWCMTARRTSNLHRNMGAFKSNSLIRSFEWHTRLKA
jgi:hypothetical protein